MNHTSVLVLSLFDDGGSAMSLGSVLVVRASISFSLCRRGWWQLGGLPLVLGLVWSDSDLPVSLTDASDNKRRWAV